MISSLLAEMGRGSAVFKQPDEAALFTCDPWRHVLDLDVGAVCASAIVGVCGRFVANATMPMGAGLPPSRHPPKVPLLRGRLDGHLLGAAARVVAALAQNLARLAGRQAVRMGGARIGVLVFLVLGVVTDVRL